jgi:hypothetical protein
MIKIFDTFEGNREIDAERLVTISYYAKNYQKKNGKIGTHYNFIKRLIDEGKLETIEIGGETFIISPEAQNSGIKSIAEPS